MLKVATNYFVPTAILKLSETLYSCSQNLVTSLAIFLAQMPLRRAVKYFERIVETYLIRMGRVLVTLNIGTLQIHRKTDSPKGISWTVCNDLPN